MFGFELGRAASLPSSRRCETKAIVFTATMKVEAFDRPPPGEGLKTVTVTVPAAAKSAAVMWACSRVLLTMVVVRLAPFHSTVEAGTKLLPCTVSVKGNAPAGALLGETAVTAGAGFGVGAGVGAGVGVGVGSGLGVGVAPEPELQPAMPALMAITSNAAMTVVARFFWLLLFFSNIAILATRFTLPPPLGQ